MSEVQFKWDRIKFGVNIQTLDREHEQLIQLMDRLQTEVDQKYSKEKLRKTLQELKTQTQNHFKQEESFFSTLAVFPHKEAHFKTHEDLLEKLEFHIAVFEKTGIVTVDCFIFLKVWLTAHIAGTDSKYSLAAQNQAA